MYHIEDKFEVEHEIPISRVKEIEIDILREFVTFCEKNQLKYFLAGGTLIGAVRHQGFIPWDDDIDVSMPRPDFEKYRELTKDGHIGKYEIRSTIHTPDIHARPFDRLCDPRYMTHVKVDQKHIPPWIDIHALDGLPTDMSENNLHWKNARKYKLWSRRSRTPLTMEKNLIKRFLKYFVYMPSRIIGPVYYADKLTEEAKKYDFYNSEFIAAYVAGYGMKERMPRYYFTDGEKKIWFEGMRCSVPPHYDLVLKHMYGNYLKLSPKKKRVTHMIKAWKIKEK